MEHYPEKCTDCGACVRICPANVIEMFKGVKAVKDLPAEKQKQR
jgi:NAD-dependent dihydropyrimidine dehydrogenase PreA subunit